MKKIAPALLNQTSSQKWKKTVVKTGHLSNAGEGQNTGKHFLALT